MLVGLGIDRGLPLGATGVRDRCDLDTATSAGKAFTAAIWLSQAAVWALATLVIAGYTDLIRKVACGARQVRSAVLSPRSATQR